MMPLWVWVALGSALGGVGRYAVAKIGPAVPGGWPIATIAVNVVGSFAIGALSVWLSGRGTSAEMAASTEAMRVFWMTGVLGGFTTYSAFALETVNLASGEAPWRAAVYVVATLVLCVAAAWAGRALAAS
jgi:CrcB protein